MNDCNVTNQSFEILPMSLRELKPYPKLTLSLDMLEAGRLQYISLAVYYFLFYFFFKVSNKK